MTSLSPSRSRAIGNMRSQRRAAAILGLLKMSIRAPKPMGLWLISSTRSASMSAQRWFGANITAPSAGIFSRPSTFTDENEARVQKST